MAKGKKKAGGGERNSVRPNGKAWKKATVDAIRAGIDPATSKPVQR